MYPAFLDDSLKKLLYGCLCHNPQSRLSAQDCVYHLNWAMAGTPHMNEQHRTKIVDTFGRKYWTINSSMQLVQCDRFGLRYVSVLRRVY